MGDDEDILDDDGELDDADEEFEGDDDDLLSTDEQLAGADGQAAARPRVPAAGPIPEPETIGGLHFVANPEYPYPFKIANPPRFWMEEQTGVLEDAVETYMDGERLNARQLTAIKTYLKQFVERAPLAGEAKVSLLLQKIDRLKTTRDIEDFADEVAEYGAEVF
jgi:hypothetical protein